MQGNVELQALLKSNPSLLSSTPFLMLLAGAGPLQMTLQKVNLRGFTGCEPPRFCVGYNVHVHFTVMGTVLLPNIPYPTKPSPQGRLVLPKVRPKDQVGFERTGKRRTRITNVAVICDALLLCTLLAQTLSL